MRLQDRVTQAGEGCCLYMPSGLLNFWHCECYLFQNVLLMKTLAAQTFCGGQGEQLTPSGAEPTVAEGTGI